MEAGLRVFMLGFFVLFFVLSLVLLFKKGEVTCLYSVERDKLMHGFSGLSGAIFGIS